MHQKPNKKTTESIPAEGNGAETKSKKSKNKKNGDLSTESSPVTQKSKMKEKDRLLYSELSLSCNYI